MVDVILVPPGETAQAFDLAIGLDRDHPTLTAFGMVSPVALVAAAKGPPLVGATRARRECRRNVGPCKGIISENPFQPGLFACLQGNRR